MGVTRRTAVSVLEKSHSFRRFEVQFDRNPAQRLECIRIFCEQLRGGEFVSIVESIERGTANRLDNLHKLVEAFVKTDFSDQRVGLLKPHDRSRLKHVS